MSIANRFSSFFKNKQKLQELEVINSQSPQFKDTIDALWKLQKMILDTLDFNKVVDRVVNAILTELGYLNLGYKILVLTLADKNRGVLKRIALSETEEAKKAQSASVVPFGKIEIPLNATNNLLIKAMQDKKPYVTHYWPDIFRPILTNEQALANQTASGIKTSMLYPLVVKEEAIGVLIFSMVKEEKDVTIQEKDLISRFTDIVGLAVQNSLLYTSLEETTESLRQANEKLKELDKLKDEFVSLSSHELRTPLAVIKSYIWMVMEGKVGPLTDKQKDYLDKTFKSTDRLISLVNDMLDVSRIESGRVQLNKQPTDMQQLAKETLDEILPKAQERSINLTVTQASNLPQVDCDQPKIKEVLINLIGNSIKFTPEKGAITISFEVQDDMVVTHVKDTGSGISSEDMPKLFQKFSMVGKDYLTRDHTQGTGLGLYIVKSYIQLHGGQVSVASEGVDKGTTFTFTLPVLNGAHDSKQNEVIQTQLQNQNTPAAPAPQPQSQTPTPPPSPVPPVPQPIL